MSTHPLLGGARSDPALVQAASGEAVNYAELAERIDQRSGELADLQGGVVLLGASLTVETVVDYLALTGIGSVVAMVDPSSSGDTVKGWIDAYSPDGAWGFDSFPDLAPEPANAVRTSDSLLLPTSGSTGSPKFVRLSLANVVANARQIVDALAIDSTHRAMGHLPLFYSYGLSVLNSHLLAGATTVLSPASAVRPEFWEAMSAQRVTSLPGVPYNYEMFLRLGLLDMDLPYLTDLTQAGGKMAAERVSQIHQAMSPKGVSLWVMYGQTEASARISVLPAAELPAMAGSVGYPLGSGSISILDPDESGVGEFLYAGPNVMLGYSASRVDLDGSDNNGGILNTGDIGRLDDAGRMWITGRLKRIAKVFGSRVSLDDVEAKLASFGTVAAIADGDGVAVFVESTDTIDKLARQMERHLKFPPRSVRATIVDRLPTTASGKIDYQALGN